MDSLLATYASSDEDDEPQQEQQHHHHRTNSTSSNTKTTTTTSSLSLPQPKQPNNNLKQTTTTLSTPKTLFSALPQPKSQPKKIVQIKPSFNPITRPQNDDEDDDDDGNEKPRRNEVSQSSLQTNSVKSFFATIPAPRNSNSLGSGFASSRRGIVETGESVEGGIDVSGAVEEQNQLGGEENVVNYDNYVDPGSGNYAGYEGYQAGVGIDSGSGSYEGYQGGVVGVDQSAMGDAGYGYYGSYGNTWGEGSGNVGMERGPEMFSGSGDSESALRVLGKKRGRKDVPAEIVEVKQDELMKNRPREDQVKLTGIAFGPSYKPVSTAGKPTKLHKRKHQIGSLYYDMKQKEMELQERRAKGFLTKAETQAKYGW